jgi:UDP-N-acetylglucosamine:LPS N-acetylglucosamine transferase
LKKEDLIYQLIFSEEESFEIKVSEYTQDIYKYDRFINEIKDILKKSKVVISKEKVDLEEDCVLWSLSVKRK